MSTGGGTFSWGGGKTPTKNNSGSNSGAGFNFNFNFNFTPPASNTATSGGNKVGGFSFKPPQASPQGKIMSSRAKDHFAKLTADVSGSDAASLLDIAEWAKAASEDFKDDSLHEILATGDGSQTFLNTILSHHCNDPKMVEPVCLLWMDVLAFAEKRDNEAYQESKLSHDLLLAMGRLMKDAVGSQDTKTNEDEEGEEEEDSGAKVGEVEEERACQKKKAVYEKERDQSWHLCSGSYYWLVVVNNLAQSEKGATTLLTKDFRDCLIHDVGLPIAGYHDQCSTVWNRCFSSLGNHATKRAKLEVLCSREYFDGFHKVVAKHLPVCWDKDCVYRCLTAIQPISSFCCYDAPESVGAQLYDSKNFVDMMSLLSDYCLDSECIDQWCFTMIVSIDALRNGNAESEVFDTHEKLKEQIILMGLLGSQDLLCPGGPIERYIILLNRFSSSEKRAKFYDCPAYWKTLDQLLSLLIMKQPERGQELKQSFYILLSDFLGLGKYFKKSEHEGFKLVMEKYNLLCNNNNVEGEEEEDSAEENTESDAKKAKDESRRKQRNISKKWKLNVRRLKKGF